MVCDDVNLNDALEAKDGVSSVKHIVVIGNDGKGQGCVPVR